MARFAGYNKVQVSRFFNNVRAELEVTKFDAEHIFDVDETGITA